MPNILSKTFRPLSHMLEQIYILVGMHLVVKEGRAVAARSAAPSAGAGCDCQEKTGSLHRFLRKPS